MISKLTGRVDTLEETYLILDVNGVGYFLACSAHTLRQVGSVGEKETLFIETVMRAESLQLYGFSTKEEQRCFRLLITVQGVGMRMALSLLSALSPENLYHAIAIQDKESLTRAEGVGPKLANRILGELKDKIPTDLASSASPPHGIPQTVSPVFEEATSALVNLGYRRTEVLGALAQSQKILGETAELNDLIRQGLHHLARGSA